MTASVSQTARRVAALRLRFARAPWPPGDADADDRLQADVAAGAEAPADSRFTRYLERRTAFFDTAVVDAIAGEVGQVAVLGCGYDGRSLRFRADGVQWFDVDHPVTLLDRLARLERLGITPDARAVAADFGTDDLAALLVAAGWNPAEPGLFLCEGVSPYLSRDEVARLLAAAGSVAGPGGSLAIDFALQPETAEGVAERAALAARVEALEEPFHWAPGRNDVAPLLECYGWLPTAAVDPAGVPMHASTARTVFVTALVSATPSGRA